MLRLNDQQIHDISRKLEYLGCRKSDAEAYLRFATGQKNPAMTPGTRENIERDICYQLADRRKDAFGWVKDKPRDKFCLIDRASGGIVVGMDSQPVPPMMAQAEPTYCEITCEEAMQFTRPFEDLIEHMYLDSRNQVTIGIGHLIPNEAEAKKLSLKTNASPTRAATDQEKVDEFRALRKLGTPNTANNTRASNYKKYTKLYIESGAAESLFTEDMEKHIDDADRLFTLIFMPQAMQIAFVDLIYQRGPGIGRKSKKSFKVEYVLFSDAIRRGDWAVAGEQSATAAGPDERNDAKADKGREAARKVPFFIPADGKTITLPEVLAKLP